MRILVIRFSSLGDVILVSSILDPLYKAGYTVDFLTLKPFAPLFEKDYRINRLISPDKNQLKSLSQIKQFASSLENYDMVIDIHRNLRSFLLTKFLNARVLKYPKNVLKRRAYTNPFLRKFIKDEFNVLQAYSQPLKELGINLSEIPKPEIILTPEEKEKVKKILPESFVAIGAGARYQNKSYPYYDKVAKLLGQKGFNVVLIGSKEDKESDSNIYPENTIDLRGRLSLRESLAAISHAKLTISNDSAVAHMSRAVQVPVLMVYGATHPYFGFAPLKEEGDYMCLNLPCQPCDIHGKKKCKLETVDCLTGIAPAEITEKALQLIKL
ncbi:glycosyltransferase family 9 protein [Persephonella sp.]|uniref:glycosyltransferase family 9 protein n=1 Tax=Persephonella sp. TaxID=2060922 RepID=UPI002602C29A|nr:glycosyltransferase family 9 protein [Persephonella sp.]